MTISQPQSVKSLNKGSAGKRFVFKSFNQRLEEIEIDVYRNIHALKDQPAEGSCFFRECLTHWRELNTAEDFISFYEEVTPWLQTLPQLLLHKEKILEMLLFRLKTQAQLSLEPILRLIAALSRDLLEDFIPFLQDVVKSFVDLLRSGGDREAETIELVFTSLSSIIMHLQKYLVCDILHVLRITIQLRYYKRVYIQEFVAQAVSFLLRNAPNKQLTRGVRKVIREAVRHPRSTRKYGVISLLWYTLRGTSSKLHSKASKVMCLLMSKDIVHYAHKLTPGATTIIEVITGILNRICNEYPAEELMMALDCVLQRINNVAGDIDLFHFSCLSSVVASSVKFGRGKKIVDYCRIFELVELLVQKCISLSPVNVGYDRLLEVTLQLIQNIFDIPSVSSDQLSSSGFAFLPAAEKWAPIFYLNHTCLLKFLEGMLRKGCLAVNVFREHIIGTMSNLLEASPQQVICSMMMFLDTLEKNTYICTLDGALDGKVSKIQNFFQDKLFCWIASLKNLAMESTEANVLVDPSDLAVLWGILSTYPNVFGPQADASLLVKLIDVLDELITIEDGCIAGNDVSVWQSLVGAALGCYHKLLLFRQADKAELHYFMSHAKRYNICQSVLFAAAEYLDSTTRSSSEACGGIVLLGSTLGDCVGAIDVFSENLALPNKNIRLPTLRILGHYLSSKNYDEHASINDQIPEKLDETSQTYDKETSISTVIHFLHSIESMPLSTFTSRKIEISISKIERSLSTMSISEVYVPILFYGIIGILYIRFSRIWDGSVKCLSSVIERYTDAVWNNFILYLEKCQSEFLESYDQDECDLNCPSGSTDLLERFRAFTSSKSDRTPCPMILCLLLQSLQKGKVASIAESKSRQLIPLFFKFVSNSGIGSVGFYIRVAGQGEEWRDVLKEWLNLLKLMRNPRSLFQSEDLKDILSNLLCNDVDSDMQMKVLDCLLTWKDEFLLPYEYNLRNLILPKNLREELTTWRLSRDSLHIQEEHRCYLIPLVIRILVPKVRNLKASASCRHRSAILCFLSELDLDELPLFFFLIFKHLNPAAFKYEDFDSGSWSTCEGFVRQFHASRFVTNLTGRAMMSLHLGRRSFFLNVVNEILHIFNEALLRPFLGILTFSVVRLLEACTLNFIDEMNVKSSFPSDQAGDAEATYEFGLAATGSSVAFSTNKKEMKKIRHLRSLSLKIIAFVLEEYELHHLNNSFWEIFFKSVKPLIRNFKLEGCAGKKPSSLFLCFLAMSRSPSLVHLLHKDETLVPNIFSVLSVKTLSIRVLTSVFNFIENLLILDEDLERNNDFKMKNILLQYLDVLTDGLQSFFVNQKIAHRKLRTLPGGKVLSVFRLLSKYIMEPSAALCFIKVVSLFLKKSHSNSDECVKCLRVIEGLLPVLATGTTKKVLPMLHRLIIHGGQDVRLAICDILHCLAAKDHSLDFLANVFGSLNSYCVQEIDSFDYDSRLAGYEAINDQFFRRIGEVSSVVILCHCVYDMFSCELILRQCALKSLLSFVKFSATILSCEGDSHHVVVDNASCHLDEDSLWTKNQIVHIVDKFILKHIGIAMAKENCPKKEWMSLLREMILRFDKMPSLSSFNLLCSEDVEVDFFHNIFHLQKHRQIKALSRFRSVISAGNISEKVVIRVFIPLLFNMLFEAKEGEHIRDACLDSLGCASGIMQWGSYHLLLVRCFREMSAKPDKKKVLLRLVCSVLDKFHFSCVQGHALPGDSAISGPLAFSASSEIQATLEKSLLPEILKLLASNCSNVNVIVNLAALKLLKLLPAEVMDLHLPSVIHPICSFLKNRLPSVRDEARLALGACFTEMGPAYLRFIIEVLKSSLRRGYELHVLGYTLHSLLAKPPILSLYGKLDSCLDELLSVIENDILGDVAEEKEVEKIAVKMKETRKNKSFDSLRLVAQSITFKSCAPKLLSPVRSCLRKHLTQRMRSKLETMLHHVALGIECNASVELTDLFVFVYGLIGDGISSEMCHGSDIIVVFALGLLSKRLKNMRLLKANEELLSALEPFVNLLVKCLKSRFEGVMSGALRCLAQLTALTLPSLEIRSEEIMGFVLDFVLQSGNADSPIMHCCLKLLTSLLQFDRVVISSSHLKSLFHVLLSDLENGCSSARLVLFMAIVRKRLVIHEVYDLAKKVSNLMVLSESEPVRKLCSNILLQFLLNYPLHEKRLQQHLDFLLENLSYVHPSGREAVLEMIHAVLVKFPPEVLSIHGHKFYIKLVVSLANEQDDKIRAMVGAAIKLLTQCINQQACNLIVDASLTWYANERPKSWSIGAQALGLLVEVFGKKIQSHISTILAVSQNILANSAHVIQNGDLKVDGYGNIAMWKESYHTLDLFEKILRNLEGICFQEGVQDIWDLTCKYLLHPHIWLRHISSRLVALYFNEVSKAGDLACKVLDNLVLMEPSRLFVIAVSHCCQLKYQWREETTAAWITQNLAFAICGIISIFRQKKRITIQQFWSDLDPTKRQRYLDAFESLGIRKEKDAFFLCVSGGEDCQLSKGLESFLVVSLLKNLGKLAFQLDDVQMKAIFNCFRIISLGIDPEACHGYAVHLIGPLYKTCEGYAGKTISGETKQLAEEVRDCIRDILGIETFLNIYNSIRKDVKNRREHRKQEIIRLSIINPMRHAKRKLRSSEKHRLHKKRKIMKLKGR